ncbi:MAG: nitroreductase family protein [Desulfoprunum sp.]|nr:nitroreductase family protein [Desulfoprunum sp.]
MEQQFMNVIRERRSIRRFTEQEVEPEKLAEIFAAASWAPSWGNSQCWEIVVVQDVDMKVHLAEILSPKNPVTRTVANAPVVLAICGQARKAGWYSSKQVTRYEDWLMYALGLLSQNICLAARSLGLGSVIVGAFDHGRAEELLQIPEGFKLISLIPLGYPDHAPSPPARRPVAEFVHYDRF